MDKTQEKIVHEFIKYLLEHKKQPASVMAFTDQLKLKESTFFKYFKSFDDLEKTFWKIIFDEVLIQISSQDVYQSYSVNEKLLAFYYSWIEKLKDYRSYAGYVSKNEKFYEYYPSEFELFKNDFTDFVGNLIEEGLMTEEIAKRQFIADKYKYLLWAQPVSIFKFWVKDESDNYQDTDALIEKTVNFSFDLMRSNSVDSFFDLAKISYTTFLD